MQLSLRNRRLIIVIVAFIVAAALVVALLPHSKKSNSSTTTNGNVSTTYDSNSKSKVQSINGENNSYGSAAQPLFLGGDALVNEGLSTSQLTNVETAFDTYSKVQALNIQQISVSVDKIQPGVINPGQDNQLGTLTFPVVFDSKTTVTAQVQYSGLDNIELFLTKSDGTKLYDSGVITTANY